MLTKKMASLSVVTLSAVCLLAIPGVGRADTMVDWYFSGTETLDHDRTITEQMMVGFYADGTLNQTAGVLTVNTPYLTAIGQGPESTGRLISGVYNMSGDASLITVGSLSSTDGADVRIGNGPYGSGTWTLTDNATATIGKVLFDQSPNVNTLLLSGIASFNATDLGAFLTGDYISFASDSLATLTVASRGLSDYQTLVSDGYIRVDGVVQSDFSKFQVTGHMLSLAVPEPGAIVLLATGLIGLLAYAWRKRKQ